MLEPNDLLNLDITTYNSIWSSIERDNHENLKQASTPIENNTHSSLTLPSLSCSQALANLSIRESLISASPAHANFHYMFLQGGSSMSVQRWPTGGPCPVRAQEGPKINGSGPARLVKHPSRLSPRPKFIGPARARLGPCRPGPC